MKNEIETIKNELAQIAEKKQMAHENIKYLVEKMKKTSANNRLYMSYYQEKIDNQNQLSSLLEQEQKLKQKLESLT
jgi:predicted  nucleic acid-binding Zn-ribbon protein